MDTRSIWRDKAHRNIYFSTLKENIDVQVVVIGGGVTGLTTAINLCEAGKNVALIEAEQIGAGTTGSSSCHLTSDIDYGYRNIIKNFSPETASLVAGSRVAAIQHIEQIIERRCFSCGFKRVPGYLYTESEDRAEELKEEAESAGKAGLDVSLTQDIPLQFPVKLAASYPHEARINMQNYLQSVADLLRDLNCKLYEHSRVTGIREENGRQVVETRHGRIKADAVVQATHYPLFIDILQTVNSPHRSYIISAPLESEMEDALFWDNMEPYHYFRKEYFDNKPYIIAGGADHKTGAVTNTEEQFQKLEEFTRERFKIGKVEYKWSAQYYEPADGLPYIGHAPLNKNVYVATGFSGDGLVYGTLAGMIISDQILGRKNKWSEVYDSTRFTPVASAKKFLKENSDVTKHLILDRIKAAPEFNEVKKGEGKIFKKEGEKVAVARDENDDLIILSPVCPHMKCHVNWNSGEKSWDCPCHGSRFNVKGEVINGPATENLERKNLSTEENSETGDKRKKKNYSNF